MKASINRTLAFAAKLLLPLSLTLSSATLAGCNSTSSSRAEGTAQTASALRVQYSSLGDEIAVTLQSLDAVSAARTVELSEAFELFSSQLRKLESSGRRVSRASESLQKNRVKFTETWEAQIEEVQNPQIRALAEKRNSEAQARFEKVEAELDRVQTTYTQLEDNLNDISIVLEADLSRAGVGSLQQVIQTASGDAKTARADIERIVAMLDWISSALAKHAVNSEETSKKAQSSR